MSDKLIVEALHNDLLVRLDQKLPQIREIANNGPQNLTDLAIIEMCMHFISDYLLKRQAEAIELELE